MLYTLLLLVMLRLIIKIECRPPDSCATWSIHFRELNASQPHNVRLVYTFFKKKKKKIPGLSRYYKVQSGAWNIFVCVYLLCHDAKKKPGWKACSVPMYIDLFHLSLTVSINKRAPIFYFSSTFLLLWSFFVCFFFLLSVRDLSIKEFSI